MNNTTNRIAPPCTDQGRVVPKTTELPLFYGALGKRVEQRAPFIITYPTESLPLHQHRKPLPVPNLQG